MAASHAHLLPQFVHIPPQPPLLSSQRPAVWVPCATFVHVPPTHVWQSGQSASTAHPETQVLLPSQWHGGLPQPPVE